MRAHSTSRISWPLSGQLFNVSENQLAKDNHYYLIEVNHKTKSVEVTGFKQADPKKLPLNILKLKRRSKITEESDAVLVSMDSMAALRRAYPNYFLDTKVFVDLMNVTLSSIRKPPKRSGGELSLFRA